MNNITDPAWDGIEVVVQDAIESGRDFSVELSLENAANPAQVKVTAKVPGGADRKFGMRRGNRELPSATEHHITIAGAAVWTIFGWGVAAVGDRVTVHVEEEAGPRRGVGHGTVLR